MLAAIIGMVSCSKNEMKTTTAFSVKAASPAQTRVSYTGGEGSAIQPSWEINDAIIGWDDLGQAFTFTVSAVNGGVATLSTGSYVPGEATTLYAVYYPGADASSIVDNEIAVNLAAQNGSLGTGSPVLMCATAAIKDNEATLNFENKTAIIGVDAVKVAPGETVTGFAIRGVNTKGRFAISGGKIDLLTEDSIAAIEAEGLSLAADSNGKVTANLYFAALPTGNAKISVNAICGSSVFDNVTPILTQDIEAGKYYYTSKILQKAEADVDGVGFETVSDAFAAANAASTDCKVTILADCAAAGGLTVNNSNAKITLDLAGKTLSASITVTSALEIGDSSAGKTGKITSGAQTIIANDGANVTITGGTLTQSSGTGSAVVYGIKGSTINITGGEITTSIGHGVYAYDGAILNISGGHISSSAKCGVYTHQATSGSNSQVTITGGVMEGTGTGTVTTSCGFYAYACKDSSVSGNAIIKSANGYGAYFHTNSTINVNGGYFSSAKSGTAAIFKGSNTTITEGYFSSKNVNWPSSTSEGVDGEWYNGTGDGIKYTYHIQPKSAE